MIKLQTMINDMLLNYPSLYRSYPDGTGRCCPENTRLMALDHLFLTIGNGLEWHPDGFMYEDGVEAIGHRELPAGFFDVDFFEVQVPSDRCDEFTERFRDLIVYSNGIVGGSRAFFVRDVAPDRPQIESYSSPTSRRLGFRTCRIDSGFRPYPVSKHSGITRALEGVTDDGTPFSPLPDWTDGIVEIARKTVAYYEGPCKPYYSGMSKKAFESFKTGQIVLCRNTIRKFVIERPKKCS